MREAGRLILVTRPEPGAAETAARLAAMGHRALSAPMLTIRPRPPLPAGRSAPQAMLITSANAVAALPESFRSIPVFAVGDATAERARAAGFAAVESAGRDAVALATLVAARCDPAGAPLLLASGLGQGMPLLRDLRAAGFLVRRRVAYAAAPAEALPATIQTALRGGEVAAALFFSPATARRCVTLLRQGRIPVHAVDALAISEAAAVPLSLLPWRHIRVASNPNQDALLALLA